MKVIVCVKQVPDTSGKVAVKPDGTLDRASMATIINPDDKNAIEAALTLKDETGDGRLVLPRQKVCCVRSWQWAQTKRFWYPVVNSADRIHSQHPRFWQQQ